jgi:hypothetical protein
MAIAGWCRICGSYQYLNESWGCAQGHPWTEISNWYDPDTGQPFTPEWLQAAPAEAAPVEVPGTTEAPAAVAAPEPSSEPVQTVPAAAPAVGTRDALLGELMATFSGHGGYTAAYGNGTDLSLNNQVADANWGAGKKKVTYEAAMKAVEPERTLYFWEVLKESGGGLSFGGADFESTTTFGTKRSGKTKEVVIGPQGVVVDYSWDYAATRNLVTEIAGRHGWQVKTVLVKKKAMW